MNISDYHAAVCLEGIRRIFSEKHSENIAVHAWTIIEDSPVDIDIAEVRIQQALRVLFAESRIVETPHARPRFIVSRTQFRELQKNLADLHPGASEALELFKLLGWEWLEESLEAAYGEQSSSAAAADTEEADWEPLLLERPDIQANEAANAVDELVSIVAADNGYAATQPAERSEILRRLREASQWLRTAEYATASAIDVYVVWPFRQLASRFSVRTAVGKAAAFTASVVAAWLKAKGIRLLDSIFGG